MLAYLKVRGHVQGVGFRYHIQQKAIEFHLTGWVRNEQDGTVEIEVEGDEAILDIFIEQIKKGLNCFMTIDEVDIKKYEVQKGYIEFVIK